MSSIQVSGMSCNHCTEAVTKAMRAIPGSGEVHVDLASGTAQWSGSAGREDMAAAVIAQGFGVKE